MYYKLGKSIFSQNLSTCLNTNNEIGYFVLITCERCQQECEKLINCVKATKPILAQTCPYLVPTCEKYIVFLWFAPITSNHYQPIIENDNTH